jgi:hypothetical protein
LGGFWLDFKIDGFATLKLWGLGRADSLRRRYRGLDILPLKTLDFNLNLGVSLLVLFNLRRHKLFIPRIEVRHEFWDQNCMGASVRQPVWSRAGDLAFLWIT